MILLILLGLVVFILLYLLFLPFHYELSGSHSIEDGWEGQAYFAGFLHFWQVCRGIRSADLCFLGDVADLSLEEKGEGCFR